MDTIGLLAAWVGVVSFLLSIAIGFAVSLMIPRVQRWWAKTNPVRAERRIQRLFDDLVLVENPNNAYVSDLISLFGTAIMNLVSGATLMIASIQILDLVPAVLAAVLPFDINAKGLTRFTGISLLFASYAFIFRLSYLAVRIRLLTLPRKVGFADKATQEIAQLRAMRKLHLEHTVQ